MRASLLIAALFAVLCIVVSTRVPPSRYPNRNAHKTSTASKVKVSRGVRNSPQPPSYIHPNPRPTLKTLKMATYNTALLPGNYTAVVESIPTDVDFLALQEVWFESDYLALKEHFKNIFPYTYTPTYDQGGAVGCKASSVALKDQFEACLAANNVEYIYWSTLTVCADIVQQWLDDDYDCISCYLSGVVNGDPDYMTNCFQTNTGYPYLFGGSTGMVIMSKLPISKTQYTDLPSFLLREGFITTCVDGLLVGVSHFPFNWTYNHNQDWIDAKEYLQPEYANAMLQVRPQIMLGDFNSGPNYQSAAYNLFLEEGYTDLSEGLVSFCPDPTVGGCVYELPEDVQLAIDHIFIDAEANRFQVNWLRGNANAQLFGSPLASDHRGVRASIRYIKFRDHPACRN